MANRSNGGTSPGDGAPDESDCSIYTRRYREEKTHSVVKSGAAIDIHSCCRSEILVKAHEGFPLSRRISDVECYIVEVAEGTNLMCFISQKCGWFRGAIALEQRPSMAPSEERSSPNMVEKGGQPVKQTKNTDAPPSVRVNRGNAFLLALHVLVVSVSVYLHPIIDTGASKALP